MKTIPWDADDNDGDDNDNDDDEDDDCGDEDDDGDCDDDDEDYEDQDDDRTSTGVYVTLLALLVWTALRHVMSRKHSNKRSFNFHCCNCFSRTAR